MAQYAFLDKYGIMHLQSSLEAAKKYSGNGKVIECNLPEHQGYPAITEPVTIKDGKANIYYTLLDEERKINLDDPKFAAIKKIYDQLK